LTAIHINGVLEHDEIDNEAERIELVLLANERLSPAQARPRADEDCRAAVPGTVIVFKPVNWVPGGAAFAAEVARMALVQIARIRRIEWSFGIED
jgi:hypothetical protein